jgi:hypothetical protein
MLKSLLILIAAAILPLAASAQSASKMRPLSDFINAQVSTSSWDDNAVTKFVFVDMFGTLNKTLQAVGLYGEGTDETGYCEESPIDAAHTLVHVHVSTSNAIAYAYGPGGTTWLGSNFFEIILGYRATLADSLFDITFINDQPVGGPLPDFSQLYNFPDPDQRIERVKFVTQFKGPLRAAFGVSDGTPGMAMTSQDGPLSAHSGKFTLTYFPAAHLDIKAIGGG